MNRRPVFLISVLCFGFAFFYIPILSMMVYSFNASKLATVWGGFSTKWYLSLLSNKKVVEALILSLQIAVLSSTFATILGTMAGIALARFRRFRGRVFPAVFGAASARKTRLRPCRAARAAGL